MQLTPEERAAAELEELVRGYYAAENSVYLDPSSDPGTELDPYLRHPAYAARISDVLGFRNAGSTLESSTATVHSVEVTALDLASSPATATVEECATLAASGWDAQSGEEASYELLGLTIWRAKT